MTAIVHDQPRPGSRVPMLSLAVAGAALSVASLVVALDDDRTEILPRPEPAAPGTGRRRGTAVVGQPAAVAGERDAGTMIRVAIAKALAERGSRPTATAASHSSRRESRLARLTTT